MLPSVSEASSTASRLVDFGELAARAPIVIWAMDPLGRLTLIEGGGLAVLGLVPDRLVGTLAKDVYPENEQIVSDVRRALCGEEVRSLVSIEGREFQCWYCPSRDTDGNLVGVWGVAVDCTERMLAQQSLYQTNAELEDRVAQRTAELLAANAELEEIANGRLEALQELRDERRHLARILVAHERDRQLICYEIHDGLVQDFTAAQLHLETARAKTDDLQLQSQLDKSLELVRRGIAEARTLITGLRPPEIEQLGLVAAVEIMVSNVCTRAGKPVEFEASVKFDRLDPLVEGTIYRIVQEGLSNIQKHSQACHARVALRQTDRRIELFISDDGVGFDLQRVDTRRFGLEGIRERARLLHGAAQIRSAPGQGTQILVDLPQLLSHLPDTREPRK